MSAKNRGSKVISQEFYPTPKNTITSIINEIRWDGISTFCEPCKGDGVIYDKIPIPDKDKYYFELSEGTDYLNPVNSQKVDLILTNPPFSLAEKFIIKAIQEAKCVIMLQRINFLGSQTRKVFWESNPPTHLFVLANRPKFVARCNNNKRTEEGKKVCNNKESYQITEPAQPCNTCKKLTVPSSDATEYAWFVWCQKSHLNMIKKDKGIYVI